MNDKVSVIMPCYNSAKHVDNSIKSILEQTYKNFELIITDDSSTDSTYEKLREYEKKDSRVIIKKNIHEKGASGARRTSFQHASGRFIAFLDSDDLWDPKKLEKQIDFIKKNDLSFTYTYYMTLNSSKFYKVPKKITQSNLYLSNFIPCLTVLYDRTKITDIDFPIIKKRNDYAMWIYLFRNNSMEAHCLKECLAYYRDGNNGLSANRFSNIYYAYKNIRSFGKKSFLEAFLMTISHIIFAIIKKSSNWLYNKIMYII